MDKCPFCGAKVTNAQPRYEHWEYECGTVYEKEPGGGYRDAPCYEAELTALRRLLEKVLPVVEAMEEYEPSWVGYRCFYCSEFSNDAQKPIKHLPTCEKALAQALLPEIERAVGKEEE